MEVLIAGKTSLISDRFFKNFPKENKFVLYQEKNEMPYKASNVVKHVAEEGGEDLAPLFDAFHFETVIYFSMALDGAITVYDELEKLENLLYSSRKHDVSNFIYVCANDMEVGADAFDGDTGRMVLGKSCTLMCESYAKNSRMKIAVLKAPYIYSTGITDCFLTQTLNLIAHKKPVRIRGAADMLVDFLEEEDLSVLISRLIDNLPQDNLLITDISGENPITYESLLNILKGRSVSLKVTYRNKEKAVPKYRSKEDMRKMYGWSPLHEISEDVETLYGTLQRTHVRQEKSRRTHISMQSFRHRFITVAELVVLGALAQYMNTKFANNTLLDFFDFRLIYVVILGISRGIWGGLMAALIACGGFLLDNSGIDSRVLFYNIQNWIPFAAYFLMGSLTGYQTQRTNEAREEQQEEYRIITEKYEFLNTLYKGTLEKKNTYNSQILGYRDSYAKLYNVVKKLSSTMPDKITIEAVSSLEDILDNHSVAVYSIKKGQAFARLEVCSREMRDDLTRSLALDKYQDVINVCRQGDVYVNRYTGDENPAYAAPIMNGGTLIGVIVVCRVAAAEQSTAFLNTFKIVSDLIQDFMVRAINYSQHHVSYLTGTEIMDYASFRKVINVHNDMKNRNYGDYSLIQIRTDATSASLEELSYELSKIIRTNDVMGQGKNGDLFVLLNQSGSEDLASVRKRFDRANIEFNEVEAIA